MKETGTTTYEYTNSLHHIKNLNRDDIGGKWTRPPFQFVYCGGFTVAPGDGKLHEGNYTTRANFTVRHAPGNGDRNGINVDELRDSVYGFMLDMGATAYFIHTIGTFSLYL